MRGWIAVAGLLLAAAAAAQSGLPDGPGKATVEKVCGGCHGFTVIAQNRADKEHWAGVVDDMVSRGAEGTDDELEQVVQYLAAHYGSDAPRPKVNVNKASAEEMIKTLAISKEDAGAIVEYRAKNGNFKNLEAVKSVPGIDAKKLEEKKDSIEF